MLRIAIFFIYFIIPAQGACPYVISDMKITPCDGKAVKQWSLSGVSAEFTPDCDILVKGCSKLNVEIGDMKMEYKAYKNDLEISRGGKDVCGMTLFDTKLDCPLAKDRKLCTTEKWVTKVPKSLLPMAAGRIKGEGKLKTNVGDICYIVTADVQRK